MNLTKKQILTTSAAVAFMVIGAILFFLFFNKEMDINEPDSEHEEQNETKVENNIENSEQTEISDKDMDETNNSFDLEEESKSERTGHFGSKREVLESDKELLINKDDDNINRKNKFLIPESVGKRHEIPVGFNTHFFDIVGSTEDILVLHSKVDKKIVTINKNTEEILVSSAVVNEAVMKDGVLVFQQVEDKHEVNERYQIRYVDFNKRNQERLILENKHPATDLKFTGNYISYYSEEADITYFVNIYEREDLLSMYGKYEIAEVEGSKYDFYIINKTTGTVEGINENGKDTIFKFNLSENEKITKTDNSPYIRKTIPQLIYLTTTNTFLDEGENLYFHTEKISENDLISEIQWVHENVVFIKREGLESNISFYHIGIKEEAKIDNDVIHAYFDEHDNALYYIKPGRQSIHFVELYF